MSNRSVRTQPIIFQTTTLIVPTLVAAVYHWKGSRSVHACRFCLDFSLVNVASATLSSVSGGPGHATLGKHLKAPNWTQASSRLKPPFRHISSELSLLPSATPSWTHLSS